MPRSYFSTGWVDIRDSRDLAVNPGSGARGSPSPAAPPASTETLRPKRHRDTLWGEDFSVTHWMRRGRGTAHAPRLGSKGIPVLKPPLRWRRLSRAYRLFWRWGRRD